MRWLKHGYLGLVYLLLYLPIAVLVVFSFNASRNPYRWQGLSLEWYARLWDNGPIIQPNDRTKSCHRETRPLQPADRPFKRCSPNWVTGHRGQKPNAAANR